MQTFTRTQQLEARAGSAKDNREVDMAISSEHPVERYFGVEILDHSPDAIDLSRLADGRHPLLVDHDRKRQAGVLRNPTIGADRKLRATARFSRSAIGEQELQDVRDEIRTLVSVGYEIITVREETTRADGSVQVVRELTGEQLQREMESVHGKDWYRAGATIARRDGKQPRFRVTRWAPWEASIVSIPADPDVGVGRAAGAADPVTRSGGSPLLLPSRTFIMTDEHRQQVDEAARVRDIVALGSQYSKYINTDQINRALQEGVSVDAFKERIMSAMQSRHTDTSSMHVGFNRVEADRYSLARAIVASITGDWAQAGFEREASRAVEKKFGMAPEGFFVPHDIFRRDFNVGTGTEAGNLVATEMRGDMYVDALRAAMVLGPLGARILTGLTSNVDIPRKATPSTLGMLSEIGTAAETNPTTAKLSLTPHRIGAYIEYSKQALIQSAIALEPLLREDLVAGAAGVFEDQAFNGPGTGDNLTGVRYASGIGTHAMGGNGAAVDWAAVVALESTVANANAVSGSMAGYAFNSKTRGTLKKTQKGTSLEMCWPDAAISPDGMGRINGYRAGITNKVPGNLTKGTSTTVCSAGLFSSDWSMAVLALFGSPDVVVDPYTLSRTGQVRITLNQFVDFGIRQPGAFAKVEDLLTP